MEVRTGRENKVNSLQRIMYKFEAACVNSCPNYEKVLSIIVLKKGITSRML